MKKVVIIILIILVCCNVFTATRKNTKFRGSKIHPHRTHCPPNRTTSQPLNRVYTESRLAAVREIMNEIDALLVTSDDEHQTEMVSNSDKRREYISGFSGSAGDVIITMNAAALWTDGRYHLQADEQLDCNWLLMREGNANVPSKIKWLSSQFPNGAKIGADAKLVPANVWNNLEAELKNINKNFELIPTTNNLIDEMWTDRPVEDIKEAYTLDQFYTGKAWTQKVDQVRKEFTKLGAEAMVVTALDEIAWLLNIRGWDIPYYGFVKSYAIVTLKDTLLYVNHSKIEKNVTRFFEDHYPGQLKFRDHDDIWSDLNKFSKQLNMILTPSLCGYNPGVSKKIYNLIPDEKRLSQPSPIIYLKAKKNPTEIAGMYRAHVRDAVALCNFFQYFEQQMASGEVWDEIQLANEVDKFRKLQDSYVSQSFPTIAAYSSHGALPHYVPTTITSHIISNDSTIVIDSGVQYYDGTTDVTRTIHIGTPTKEHKNAYTRVLIGSIQLSSLIFPNNLNASAIDVVARSPLWEIGYDYPHGTGHGIGAFLAVHESPIILRYNPRGPSEPLKPGYFHSNEPGMYLNGKFGIRLENVLQVVKKTNLKHQRGRNFLGFNDVTLVPYDTKLIDFRLLNIQHRRWLNQYNARIKNIVGAELLRQNAVDAYKWMLKHTKHIPEKVFFY